MVMNQQPKPNNITDAIGMGVLSTASRPMQTVSTKHNRRAKKADGNQVAGNATSHYKKK